MNKNATMTRALAIAASRDAGNRSMRAGGRKAWAVKDFNAASSELARLMPFVNCRYTVGATQYELGERT